MRKATIFHHHHNIFRHTAYYSIHAPCTIKHAQGERIISCRVSDKTCAGCALGGNTFRNRTQHRVCAESPIPYQKQKPPLLLIIDLKLVRRSSSSSLRKTEREYREYTAILSERGEL